MQKINNLLSIYKDNYKYFCSYNLTEEDARIILVYDNNIIGHVKTIDTFIKFPDLIKTLDETITERVGLTRYSGNCYSVKFNPEFITDIFAKNEISIKTQIKPFNIIYSDLDPYSDNLENMKEHSIVCEITNVWITSIINLKQETDFYCLEQIGWEAENIAIKFTKEYM